MIFPMPSFRFALLRSLAPALLLPLGLGLSACNKPLDKEAMLRHIREKYNVISEVSLDLGPGSKSEIPGFDVYELTFKKGEQVKKERLYVSRKGDYYFVGMPGNLRENPVLEKLAKVDVNVVHARGTPGAPVTVIEYTDFECPKCAEMSAYVLGPFLKDYAGKVLLIHKHMPLPGHPWATLAAQISECVALQNAEAFWTYTGLVFARQNTITPETAPKILVDLAHFAGADTGAVKNCIQGHATEGTVRKDMFEGQSLGFNGTPTYLVNGHFITGTDPGVLKAKVDEVLAAGIR